MIFANSSKEVITLKESVKKWVLVWYQQQNIHPIF